MKPANLPGEQLILLLPGQLFHSGAVFGGVEGVCVCVLGGG